MAQALTEAYSDLPVTIRQMELPPLQHIDTSGIQVPLSVGPAVLITRTVENPICKVLLCGHLDTVFPEDSSFQSTTQIDDSTLQGPGVSDLKGGLVVMLTALRALERSPLAGKIQWEVVLNPDEEIGSYSSSSLLRQRAREHDVGLIYEPSYPDGAYVNERKGSTNWTLVIRGRKAHVGREFHKGANAIHSAARFIQEAASLNEKEGLTVNVGKVDGGGPANVVPDLAICRINARASSRELYEWVSKHFESMVHQLNQEKGISAELHTSSFRVPKPFDPDTQRLFQQIQHCSEELHLPFHYRSSGGVCDGNIFAEVGLPTIDTLGVRGGNIHTHDEYILLESLIERAKLSALYLLRLAEGSLNMTKEKHYGNIDRG